jgi:hypothetical protein
MIKKLSQLALCALYLMSTVSFGKITPHNSQTKKFRSPSSTVERPPQFVILAFDGSLNLDFWKQSQAFADTILTKGIDDQPKKLKFTYFVNPVYYIEKANKGVYSTPRLNIASSCIGWSNPTGSFVDRTKITNQASINGHEIASHANSHCDASGRDKGNPLFGLPWGEEDWTSEFNQFNNMLFNVYEINKTDSKGFVWNFKKEDIIGFRAPLLATTDGLWPTLQKFNYRYDTSKSSSPTYWPQKMSWGGWNFPLGQIKIAGSTKSTLTMDYNWMCFQSACTTKPDLTDDEATKFKNQVLESYKYYFNVNYFGNRAPIHIGHHFSQWNKGAYWNAMKEFAQFTCSRPDVRCVTYKEYATWLDEQVAKGTYDAYRKTQFDVLPKDSTFKEIAKDIALPQVHLDYGNGSFETMTEQSDQRKISALGLKKVLKVNFAIMPKTEITTDELKTYLSAKYKNQIPQNILVRAALINSKGQEVSWETYKINNLNTLGTNKENVSGPLEDTAMQPESVDAHNTPD